MEERYYQFDSEPSDPDFDETGEDSDPFATLDEEVVTAIMRAGTDFSALSRWNILAVRRIARAASGQDARTHGPSSSSMKKVA